MAPHPSYLPSGSLNHPSRHTQHQTWADAPTSLVWVHWVLPTRNAGVGWLQGLHGQNPVNPARTYHRTLPSLGWKLRWHFPGKNNFFEERHQPGQAQYTLNTVIEGMNAFPQKLGLRKHWWAFLFGLACEIASILKFMERIFEFRILLACLRI